MAGKVSLKKRLVDRDGLQPDGLVVVLESQHPVHHQEGVAVGKNLHDVVGVEGALPHRNVLHRHQGGLVGPPGLEERLGELQVQPVTGLGRKDVAANAHGKQRKVADDVEDLVPDEFIGITKGFLAHHRFPPDDDGVFQAPTLDQPLVQQRLHLLVKNKGTGPTDLPGVVFLPDLDGQELGVVSRMVGVCAGNLEALMGQGGKIAPIG